MAIVRIERATGDTGGKLQNIDYWNTPGLGIVQPDGSLGSKAKPSTDPNNPEVNVVRAFVINTSTQTHTNLVVDFYAGMFGLSAPYFSNLNGDPTFSERPASIAPGQKLAVDHNWPAPSVADLTAPNIHVCVGANCYLKAPGTPEPPALDGHHYGTSPVWDILNDPHQAQRNLTWIGLPQMDIIVGNRFKEAAEFQVEIWEDVSPRLPRIQRDLIAHEPVFHALKEQFGHTPQLHPEADSQVTLTTSTGGDEGTSLLVGLEAGAGQAVSFKYQPSGWDEPTLRRFTMVQRDNDGQIVDGATVLAIDMLDSVREQFPELGSKYVADDSGASAS